MGRMIQLDNASVVADVPGTLQLENVRRVSNHTMKLAHPPLNATLRNIWVHATGRVVGPTMGNRRDVAHVNITTLIGNGMMILKIVRLKDARICVILEERTARLVRIMVTVPQAIRRNLSRR